MSQLHKPGDSIELKICCAFAVVAVSAHFFSFYYFCYLAENVGSAIGLLKTGQCGPSSSPLWATFQNCQNLHAGVGLKIYEIFIFLTRKTFFGTLKMKSIQD